MTTAKKIEQIVSEIPVDFVFTYRDLGLTAEDSANVIKKLNRLAESGVISKLSKGRYFKPKKSIFGALNPSVEEVVKDLLERNGNIIGYLTNYSVYSQLGLTSQIPNIIVIGSNTKRSKTRRGNIEIRFVLQRNEITKANIYLLQLLDVIKSIKSIPDRSIDKSCPLIGFIDGVERAANDHINSSCLALSTKSNRPARGNAATNRLQI